jgi:hypothetical protein
MAVDALNRVSNEPLRDYYLRMEERGRLCASDVAHTLGWWRRDRAKRADVTRVRRVLGLAACHKDGRAYIQKELDYDVAVRLVRAMDMDPFEAGV